MFTHIVIYIRTLTPSSWEEMHGKPSLKAVGAAAEIRQFYEMDSLNVFVANKQYKKESGEKTTPQVTSLFCFHLPK
jgi:hypothetical protein